MPSRPPRDVTLSIAEIAERYGLAPSTVRTYNGKSAVSRRRGTSRSHDFPAPVDRIGNSPLFDAEQVRHWFEHRPGRGVGGGRPRTQTPKPLQERTT